MIKSKLMWNSVLRFVAQSYLSQSITACTSLATYASLTTTQKISSPLLLVGLMFVPAFFAFILYRNRATLHTAETKQKYGSLYMNYETDKGSAIHFTALFLYRRLFFAAVIAFCTKSVVVQVWLSYSASLLMLWYTAAWAPMEAEQYDFLAVFNEMILCISVYILLLYTDYVPEPEMRYMFGEVLLYLLYIDFGVNLLLLSYEILRLTCRSCRQRRAFKKQRLERRVKAAQLKTLEEIEEYKMRKRRLRPKIYREFKQL